jgi:hypothetical protein
MSFPFLTGGYAIGLAIAWITRHSAELMKARFHIGEMAGCNFGSFRAVAFRLVGERKKRADLVDREAEPTAVANEV